jgi:hypothetical protein
MKQRKVISLPTNESKVYRQILAFMNFLLNLTPQERDVLAELIRLDNEYAALPKDKRAKFILSTDVRKEIRDLLNIQEKQFNVILSRLKKKTFFGKSLIDENNYIHNELLFKPDSDGFRFEVNFVMTRVKPQPIPEPEPISDAEIIEEKPKEIKKKPQPPKEYKHDASKAPIIEEEEFDISLDLPNE